MNTGDTYKGWDENNQVSSPETTFPDILSCDHQTPQTGCAVCAGAVGHLSETVLDPVVDKKLQDANYKPLARIEPTKQEDSR